MWYAIIALCASASLALVMRQFAYVRDLQSRFLILFIWARFVIQALWEITATPVIAGFSIAALSTLAFAVAMFALMRPSQLQRRDVAVFFPMIAVIVLSGGVNFAVKGLINEIISWAIVVGVFLLSVESFRVNGVDRTMRGLLAACTTPVFLLVFSVLLGKRSVAEIDGAISYIAGFVTESVFSRILLVFMLTTVFVAWRMRVTSFLFLLVAIGGIVLANYRTTIVAILPLFLLQSTRLAVGALGRAAAPALVAGLTAGFVALPFVIDNLGPRYAVILTTLADLDSVLKEPIAFDSVQRKLFSTRIHMWASYVEGYLDGHFIHRLIGRGPFSYEDVFRIHAHNAYVSYLYEYGAIGVLTIVATFAVNLFAALRVRDETYRLPLVMLHLSFIILNTSTTALKGIEGLIYYAIIVAVTAHALRQDRLAASPHASARPSGLVARP